jgi:hypothetical protein
VLFSFKTFKVGAMRRLLASVALFFAATMAAAGADVESRARDRATPLITAALETGSP